MSVQDDVVGIEVDIVGVFRMKLLFLVVFRLLTFFGGIIFNTKSLSNMIPFDFALNIKFVKDFIFKPMQKKSEHIRGICILSLTYS